MTIQPENVKRLLFTSGKHYYTLTEEREKRERKDVAIIRLEELCPFPADELRQEMKKYPNAKEFLWCQEEHRNQGAWSFIDPRFTNIVGLHVCSFECSASNCDLLSTEERSVRGDECKRAIICQSIEPDSA